MRFLKALRVLTAAAFAAVMLAPPAFATVPAPYSTSVSEGTVSTTTTFGFQASLVQVHNDGAVPIYCSFDATPVAATSPAIQIPAGKAKSFDFSAGTIGVSPGNLQCITSSGSATTRIEAYPYTGEKVTDVEAYNQIPTNATLTTLNTARIQAVASAAPTCTYTSGGGTSPSCALAPGADDFTGTIIATTGTGAPTAAGSITLTFSTGPGNYGTNSTQCIFMAQNAAGSWTAPVTFIGGANSVTSYVVNMTNGAAPATSTAYQINYSCTGR